MKALLLTHHFVYNYGANLQALATCKALQSRGLHVEVVDWRAPDLDAYWQDLVPPEQAAQHEAFVSLRLPLSPTFRTADEIRDHYSDVRNRPDLVIVGSDTVLYIQWPTRSPMSHARYGNPFWLTWLDDTPALRDVPSAYLSVSNTGSRYFRLDRPTRLAIRDSINRRRIVTVRDKWTGWMMRSVGGITTPIEDGFDPVFALDRYVDVSGVDLCRLDLPERYILFNPPARRCSARWVNAFKALVESHGYQLLGLPNPQGTPHWPQLRNLFPLSPLEWYATIGRSSGYVGYRFHPIVTAMTAGVPFVAVDTYGSGPLAVFSLNFPSKTYDLCRKARRPRAVIKSRFFPLCSPKAIHAKLKRQNPDMTQFLAEARSVYERHIDRIIALPDTSQGSAVSL